MHSRFLAALLCLCATMAFATIEQTGTTITELSINGLKKTQKSVVEGLLKRFVGRPVSEVKAHDVETVLMETGLFEKVAVTIEDREGGAALLTVTLKEKWSFIPIPMFMTSSDKLMGGVFVMDANAFGLNDKAFAGGLVSSETLFGMASYARMPKAEQFGWMVGAAVSKGTKEIADSDDATLLEYDSFTWSVTSGISAELAPWAKLSLEAGYTDTKVYAKEADSVRQVTLALPLNLSRSDWDGWFLSTRSLLVKPGLGVGDDLALRPTLQVKGVFEHSLLPRLRFSTTAGAYWGPEDKTVQAKPAMTVSCTIMPDNFASSRMAGGQAGFEAALWKMRYATLSARITYQAILAEDISGETAFNHGPTAGLRVYLAKIAFPAMDLSTGYNVVTGTWQTAFSMGMTM